jgi:6-phosphogluconate dehydrogenase
MKQQHVGLVGLAVMGENLALNIERNGFSVAVWNRTQEKVDRFVEGRAKGLDFVGASSPGQFVQSVERPRRLILMVKAGEPVDAMIGLLKPMLEPGDILIDGGNSYFADTRRRCASLANESIHFIGSGVSGGEEGALWGPSMMPGGPKEAYKRIETIWTKIAAQVDDQPCCAYLGPDGAGHFVKMIHNGIEYGDMQLIAEAYHLLKAALDLSADEFADIFERWNEGPLASFLIEITSTIFRRRDEGTGRPLVDMVLDSAGQKGTGRWTSQVALDLGVPTPTINAAVEARTISSFTKERARAANELSGPQSHYDGDKADLIEATADALFAAKICSYAQGMALLQAASVEYDWSLDLATISRIWKGGCIIRAGFLDLIRQAYQRDPSLPNLLLDPEFRGRLAAAQDHWRDAVRLAARLGVPTPALSGSLAYYDGYRCPRLPQNLTQAQRDLFGAHTYERIDKPGEGPFHSDWSADN